MQRRQLIDRFCHGEANPVHPWDPLIAIRAGARCERVCDGSFYTADILSVTAPPFTNMEDRQLTLRFRKCPTTQDSVK
jgi:hypothetical protein